MINFVEGFAVQKFNDSMIQLFSYSVIQLFNYSVIVLTTAGLDIHLQR